MWSPALPTLPLRGRKPSATRFGEYGRYRLVSRFCRLVRIFSIISQKNVYRRTFGPGWYVVAVLHSPTMDSSSKRGGFWLAVGLGSCAALAQAQPVAEAGRVLLRARGQQGEIVYPEALQRRMRLPRVVSGGVIPRALLDQELAAGVSQFLQQVQVEPKHLNGRFVGFRLLSLFDQRTDVHSDVLAVGDVVTRINGLPIERPEQFFAVWQALTEAKLLTVEFQRGGMLHKVHYAIR